MKGFYSKEQVNNFKQELKEQEESDEEIKDLEPPQISKEPLKM